MKSVFLLLRLRLRLRLRLLLLLLLLNGGVQLFYLEKVSKSTVKKHRHVQVPLQRPACTGR